MFQVAHKMSQAMAVLQEVSAQLMGIVRMIDTELEEMNNPQGTADLQAESSSLDPTPSSASAYPPNGTTGGAKKARKAPVKAAPKAAAKAVPKKKK